MLTWEGPSVAQVGDTTSVPIYSIGGKRVGQLRLRPRRRQTPIGALLRPLVQGAYQVQKYDNDDGYAGHP
jgi:hypothetical protein